MSSRRTLLLLAGWNVAIHLLGLAVALAAIRPGSVLVGLEERIDFLTSRTGLWAMGWLVWMLGALSLVAFLAALVPLGSERVGLRRLSLLLAIVGAAVDLLCEALQVLILPALAAAEPLPELFLELEDKLLVGGTVVANGLYSAAVLLMTIALAPAGGLRRILTLLGAATALGGGALALGGLLGRPSLVEAAVGPTILFYCAWCLTVAVHVGRPTPTREVVASGDAGSTSPG